MLTEEEKKAIKYFSNLRKTIFEHRLYFGEDCIIKCGSTMVAKISEVKSIINRLEKENEELKKYDYRNIKLDEKDELKSPSIPKEKLDLMNTGIAIYKSIDKIFNDEESKDV